MVLITCWSTDDVWNHSKCWKGCFTHWKKYNFHQLMMSKNVRNAQHASNDYEQSYNFDHLLISWWHLKTSPMVQMRGFAMNKSIIWLDGCLNTSETNTQMLKCRGGSLDFKYCALWELISWYINADLPSSLLAFGSLRMFQGLINWYTTVDFQCGSSDFWQAIYLGAGYK